MPDPHWPAPRSIGALATGKTRLARPHTWDAKRSQNISYQKVHDRRSSRRRCLARWTSLGCLLQLSLESKEPLDPIASVCCHMRARVASRHRLCLTTSIRLAMLENCQHPTHSRGRISACGSLRFRNQARSANRDHRESYAAHIRPAREDGERAQVSRRQHL